MRVKQFVLHIFCPQCRKIDTPCVNFWLDIWKYGLGFQRPPFDCGNISHTSLFLWKSALQWILILFPTKEVVRNIVFGQGAMIWGWAETLHHPPSPSPTHSSKGKQLQIVHQSPLLLPSCHYLLWQDFLVSWSHTFLSKGYSCLCPGDAGHGPTREEYTHKPEGLADPNGVTWRAWNTQWQNINVEQWPFSVRALPKYNKSRCISDFLKLIFIQMLNVEYYSRKYCNCWGVAGRFL